MGEKLSKISSVIKKDGIKVAFGKIAKYAKGAVKRRVKLSYKSDFNKNSEKYKKMIESALSGDNDRVFVWRSSFGWNVPLFQRPQHISRTLAKKRCLVFYEVTSMTDDVDAIEKKTDNLYLVNFENPYISELLFAHLDKESKPKYLQFYSTDWTMSREYVEGFVARGYKILYEYIDDVTPDLAGTKELPRNIAEKFEYAMTNPDDVYVVATADLLYKNVISRRGEKNSVFSTNGVDYDFYQSFDEPFEFEDEFKQVLSRGKPIVGYYGAMARWLDYELLKEISKTGKYTFVLFGVRYDDSLDASGILNLENVVFFGPREYEKLKYYAKKIDVLTIPFVINDITRATSPLKLFEYMALHKPIVTSAMNECMKYKSPLIAHSREEFISLLDEALCKASDPDYIALLDREARENSWDHKADEIINMLKKAD